MPKQYKYRIAILGIGGVGGYIGGKLASEYAGSEEVEIIFIARGDNLATIKEKGLRLITPESDHIILPDIVSDEPAVIGTVDLLICCVKSYDLNESIRHYRSCISDQTIILPLENGVDASEKIKAVIPAANILDGCIYLNSRLTQAGVVNQIGVLHSLYFGAINKIQTELPKIAHIFKNANIDASVSDDILQTLWEKFVFISAIATATSYLDASIGEILSSEQSITILKSLIEEATDLANAKQITLPLELRQNIIRKASAMPFEATSSMHTDFKNKRRTEIDSLTAYVVRQGEIHNIATPTYSHILGKLLSKTS